MPALYRTSRTRLAFLAIVAILSTAAAGSRQAGNAQDGAKRDGVLISRGLTDAATGTAIIAGDPVGGATVIELRAREGQKVERGEIIAVLSNYPKADVTVRMGEADLAKKKLLRDRVVHGTRIEEITLQEARLKTTEKESALKAVERARSAKPADQRELEAKLDEQSLERQRANLQLAKETLAREQSEMDGDIAHMEVWLDGQRQTREQALVRSPLDGAVVQIFSRQGERVSPSGIVKIVDMAHLRVMADVDEVSVSRTAPGGKVVMTFRGDPTVYKGTITRIAPTVKRMQRADPEAASSTDSRTMQVEIEFDDPSAMPQVLGREARVTFL